MKYQLSAVSAILFTLGCSESPDSTKAQPAATKNGAVPDSPAKEYVKITDPGDSDFNIGAVVTRSEFDAVDAQLRSEGKLPPLRMRLD